MIDFERKSRYDYQDLLEVIHLLRSPEGCPWDKVQTHASIRREMLEEAYEAVEAIDLEDPAALREELGDVLMQVVFHADIESDAGRFNMEDVVDEITKKMIYRHPHVFADAHERAGQLGYPQTQGERSGHHNGCHGQRGPYSAGPVAC